MIRPQPRSTLFPYTTLFRSPDYRTVFVLYHEHGQSYEAIAEVLDRDRKSTRLNSSHLVISYAVFCLKKKKQENDDAVVGKRSRCVKHRHDIRIQVAEPRYFA